MPDVLSDLFFDSGLDSHFGKSEVICALGVCGCFAANGIFGQFIFVNPTEQVVIALQSAWRQPHDSDAAVENIAMIRAAVRALRTEPAS